MRLVLAGVVLAMLGSWMGSGPASAQVSGRAPVVGVVKVDGLVDPVLAAFVTQSIAEANAAGDVAVVLQLDSPGVVVSDDEFEILLATIRGSVVPVDVWIGPSGAEATGLSAMIAGAASVVGMAPGTRLGLDGEVPTAAMAATSLRTVPTGTVGAREAEDLGISRAGAPTIGDFMVNLEGVETRQVTQGDQIRRELVTQVRFTQLSLVDQLFHAVASPAVTYLLFMVGMGLILFELFTAGVGIAGVAGAGAFVLAGYGLGVLPARWWAVAALVVAMAAFAVDVQTGVPRFWTGVGFALVVIASLFFFDGYPLSWITLLVAFAGMVGTFLAGMPSMVRTRFATPTIGREWLIGETGRAVGDIAPDGVVRVRDAPWRATTDAEQPIDELDRVLVVGVEGLVLQVRPDGDPTPGDLER